MIDDIPIRSLRDRILVLRSVPAFRTLDDEALAVIAEHARRRRFAAGDVVAVEGKPPTHAHLVITGQITVRRLGYPVVVIGRDGGLGFVSIQAREREGPSAIADEETVTLEIPAAVVDDALEENFGVVRNTLRLQALTLLRQRGGLPASPDAPPPIVPRPKRERPPTLAELVIELSSAGVFARCNVDAVIELARRTRYYVVPEGEVIFPRGSPSTSWIRIDSGVVRCATPTEHVDLGPGFVAGIMDGIASQPRSFEARALTEVGVFDNDREALLAVLESHPSLARDFIALLARTVIEGQEAVARKAAEAERVAVEAEEPAPRSIRTGRG